jgi:hypothetical protein
MVSMSSKALKFAPKIVRAGLANAATGSGMSGGKRLASLSPPKLRIDVSQYSVRYEYLLWARPTKVRR